jgi:16S rRNA (guanine966-N2)-methyltransferase
MTRVVAGAARGRRLAVPDGTGTRPTSDRAREGLFSSLTSMLGAWSGRRVLDLYAGSGAVGLEALSRGAAHCLLAESDARVLRVLRANVEALALPGAEVHGGRVERLLVSGPPGAAYDVVFLDPPYDVGDDALRAVLAGLRDHGWLGPDAVVAVERPTRGGPWDWPAGFTAERSRRYGEATLWYGRAAGPQTRAAPVESAGG